MHTIFEHHSLFKPATILTINERDRRWLHHQCQSLPSPPIMLTLSQWLAQNSTHFLRPHELFPNAWQRKGLWLDFLMNHPFPKPADHLDHLDRHYGYLRMHHRTQLSDYWCENQSQQQYKTLMNTFHDWSNKQHYIDDKILVDRWLETKNIAPDFIFSRNENDYLYRHICRHLPSLPKIRLPHTQPKLECLSSPDALQEIQAMFDWAFKHHASHPSEKIHLICPDLESHVHWIEVLAAQMLDHYQVIKSTTWAAHPVTAPLLELLNFQHASSVDIEDLGCFLTSPYLPHADLRLRIFYALKDNGIKKINNKELYKISKQYFRDIKEELWWKITLRNERDYPKVLQVNDLDYAKEIGWPYQTDPDTKQVVRSWFHTLEQWTTQLALDLPKTKAYAKAQILHLSKQLMPTPLLTAPIIICDAKMPEAGLADAVWLMHCIQGSYDHKTHHFPMLPAALQPTDAPMVPTRLPELLSQCQLAMMSYPVQIDGVPTQPLVTTAAKKIYEKTFVRTEKFTLMTPTDCPLPSLPLKTHYPSQLLNAQSSCAFQAYARYQLNLKPKDLIEPLMLSRAERGALYHKILENIWKNLHTQMALLAMNHPALEAMIIERTEQAMHPIQHLSKTIKESEKKRAVAHIHSWLDIEKTRPKFKVIAHEKEIEIKGLGLNFQCRVDRIDETDDGLLIIDYKTGQSTPSAWFGARPTDLQLPLYSLAFDTDKISGLAFALLHGQESRMVGMGAHLTPISDVFDRAFKPMQSHWQKQIQTLIHEFINLPPEPNPSAIKHCQYCPYIGACRYHHERGKYV